MEAINKQHVQLPNDMTVNENLTPQDLLIYVAIKRYMNKDTKEAFPSLQTICAKSGASINTVRKCINNLEAQDYFKIEKRGRQNYYIFSDYQKFEPFSYDFLDKEDLTFTEKAYIIASQQYMFKDEKGIGKISYTNSELSEKILSAANIDFSVRVEKLELETGSTVTFDQVLAVSDNGLKVGSDVANATVTGTVTDQARGKKIIVYKYKRKTGYHKKNGHRQAYTEVKIDKINA